jgi:hypothetical protein
LSKPAVKRRGWFYQHFICAHVISGEIRVDRRKSAVYKVFHVKKRRYKFCSKCGRKYYGY